MQAYTFHLFADYFQFYLQDEQATGSLSDSWSVEAVKRKLALAPGIIGVRTARNTTVPVTIVIGESAPNNELDVWDHMNDCTINVSSGRLVIAGCTDYFPEAARIVMPPGCYHARVYYGGQDTISENGLEGNDVYKVILWLVAPIEA
jgi:hypothetical protein